jgi:gamma-glutamylputrescine oxidase
MSQAKQHCPSYYAATRNDFTEYSPLQGDVHTDVCVIGGGFSGISTALTLAERGFRVTLLEQHRVGWGASGRNGGQIIGGMAGEGKLASYWRDRGSKESNEEGNRESEDLMFKLGWRGHEIIAERVAKYAIDCDLKYGYMDVAVQKSHENDLKVWHEDLVARGRGDEARLLEADELPSLIGTARYRGALLNNRSGHLHPLNLCLGEARAATQLGVNIHEGTEVLEIKHGKRPQVVAGQGTVTSDFVVLAGNAYHKLERPRLNGLVFPAGSYIIATEPLSEAEAAQINSLDVAVCDMNHVIDYFRLSADRRLLFGGRGNFSGRDPNRLIESMRPRMLDIYPQLKEKKIEYAWGGKIGIVLNRVPILGRTSPNVLFVMGYSGHGVNMTHACSEAIADAVTGTMESFDFFAEVPHRPIPFSQWFGKLPEAAGMLYYRLRDQL